MNILFFHQVPMPVVPVPDFADVLGEAPAFKRKDEASDPSQTASPESAEVFFNIIPMDCFLHM